MSLKGKPSIYSAPSLEGTDSIKLISDRVLVRDLPESEMEGSIFLPEICRDKELIRQGIVVAVGPGDRFLEVGYDERDERVLRRLLTAPCEICEGTGMVFDLRAYQNLTCPDPSCDGGRIPVCVPPQCQPGDKVLYSRRREAEVYIGGVRHSLVHAEQSILAVLESE